MARSTLMIALYSVDKRGEVGHLTSRPIDYFGSCPVPGDRLSLGGSTNLSYLVLERIFIDAGDEPIWALVVEYATHSKPLQRILHAARVVASVHKQIEEQHRRKHDHELDEILDRFGNKSNVEKYPRLYPTEGRYSKMRKPMPAGKKSPIWPPLESWEKRVLNYLLGFKAETRLPLAAVKGLGASCLKSLLKRGYVGSTSGDDDKRRKTVVWLTQKAIHDVEADKALRCKYFEESKPGVNQP